nr:alpha/beta hydrolase [Rhodococcus sp. 06-621-2]
MNLPPGVRSVTTQTSRLRLHHLEAGPVDGVPLVLVHGNLSSGRFYEDVMPALAKTHRVIAPDMRGFGDSERVTLDATRGLADWADDIAALLEALDIDQAPHLLGWSTGAGAITRYVLDGRTAASLTLMDPVPPYGFVGMHADGTPWFSDYAGCGAGVMNAEFTERIAAGDRSTDSLASPRNVAAGFWGEAPPISQERVDVLIDELLKTWVSEDNFPGSVLPSENWPGIAPGTTGILNALSPKYCDWSRITELGSKPPIMWIQGGQDDVISNASHNDPATLGAAGLIPGWPGEDVCPAQPMITQIRDVLQAYEDAGGRTRTEWFEASHHLPMIEEPDRWLQAVSSFVAEADAIA